MGKPRHCLACEKSKDNSETFFKFPNSPERKKEWIDRLKIHPQKVKSRSAVCSIHFSKEQMVSYRLKRKAIPDITEVNENSVEKAFLEISLKNHLLGHKQTRILQNLTNIQPAPLRQVRGFPLNVQPVVVKTSILQCHDTGVRDNRDFEANQDLNQTVSQKQSPRSVAQLQTQLLKLKRRLKTQVQINKRQRISKEKSKQNSLWIHRMEKMKKKSPAFSEWINEQIVRYSTTKNYSTFEKSSALTIFYSCGFNGYMTLKMMGFKLPGIETIRGWIRPLNFLPGVNREIMELLREQVKDMKECDKDCIVMWDEMNVKKLVLYDKNRDCFEGIVDHGCRQRKLEVASEVLVLMVSSIRHKWKCPIAFYFSKSNTTSVDLEIIIRENIRVLLDIGLNVRIGVCDMGFPNQGLYRSLGVSSETPFATLFDRKIYFIHDTPHLIKLIRNNRLVKTFFFPESDNNNSNLKPVKWMYLHQFYRQDLKIHCRMAPKLTKLHLFVKDFSKMKVKLACQVFSHTVAAGMRTMIKLGCLNKDATNTARFVKFFDELFDLLNISKEYEFKNHKSGRYLAENIALLDKYFITISRITVSRDKPDCLKGLLITIKGIKLLTLDLLHDGYKYVLTRKLQQDPLENLFSFIRSKGGCSKNPTTRQFVHNFRFVFLTSIMRNHGGGNCETRVSDELLFSNFNKLQCVFVNKQGETRNENAETETLEFNDHDLFDDGAEFGSAELGPAFYGSEAVKSVDLYLQESNIAKYMANYAVKSVIKSKKCENCRKMLSAVCDTSDTSNLFIYEKAYNVEIFNSNLQGVSYRDCLSDSDLNIFEAISNQFIEVARQTLTECGTEVLWLMLCKFKEVDVVSEWLQMPITDECKEHREFMIRLFLRAKIFRLVKDINDKWKQSKAWNQTRRDLRHQ